mmetsp:Transcript_30975/g.61400  ORF Transcript_30975/g.61400 Transcript_30975/m.61400 type:complete len:229 (-) Transcript_30975:887-1573(-)
MHDPPPALPWPCAERDEEAGRILTLLNPLSGLVLHLVSHLLNRGVVTLGNVDGALLDEHFVQEPAHGGLGRVDGATQSVLQVLDRAAASGLVAVDGGGRGREGHDQVREDVEKVAHGEEALLLAIPLDELPEKERRHVVRGRSVQDHEMRTGAKPVTRHLLRLASLRRLRRLLGGSPRGLLLPPLVATARVGRSRRPRALARIRVGRVVAASGRRRRGRLLGLRRVRA